MRTSLSFLSLFAFGCLFAEKNDIQNLAYYEESNVIEEEEDECCEEIYGDPCAQCAQLWPTCGPDWIVTPNAGPCVQCGADIFLTVDFIYWTIREDGLGFALLNNSTTGLATPFAEKGRVYHPDWRFEPGFKVGLGFFFGHDGWDLYGNYTWLRTRKTLQTAFPKDNKVLTDPYVWTPGLLNTVSQASGEWKHDFNVVDLELGRNFFVSRCLYLRPHVGFKGTWQDQDMDVTFLGTNGASNPAKDEGNHDLDFWGVGVRAGLDTSWHFNRCFSLFGDIAASVLWGRFKANAKLINEDLSTNIFAVPFYAGDSFHTTKPVLEGIFGIRFEDWFCCDEFHYGIEAGWEMQWWGEQNQFLSTFAIENRHGDLTIQGFTLKFRFDF